MVAAGYTRHVPEEPYRAVREMVAKLNRSALFEGVDLMPADDVFGREDVFAAWGRFLSQEEHKRNSPAGNLKSFTLRVPFAETDIRRPAERGRAP